MVYDIGARERAAALPAAGVSVTVRKDPPGLLPYTLSSAPNHAGAVSQVLYDIGAVSGREPFQRLVSQGMILGETEYSLWQDEAGTFCEPDTPGAVPIRFVCLTCLGTCLGPWPAARRSSQVMFPGMYEIN